MKVAVVGGGVFGCLAAVELARTGAYVELFEARSDILSAATAHCQARLHSGYHYPRSDATATASRDATAEFAQRFPDAIRRAKHHYVIAGDSKVTPEEYFSFCDRLGLPYRVVTHPAVIPGRTVVRVPEAFVNVDVLRRLIRRDLFGSGVRLQVERRVEPDDLGGYDLIVAATYGRPWSRPLRYEVCEVALVQLGRFDADESFVVIDGPFVSLDPARYGFMLYDVTHSVHHANVGWAPEVPPEYQRLLNRGGPVFPELSHVDAMLDTASHHLRGIDRYGRGVCIYGGSLFTVRAVLPDVDCTDERPTLVERDGNLVHVLSGKIGTAVTAARQVAQMAMVAA